MYEACISHECCDHLFQEMVPLFVDANSCKISLLGAIYALVLPLIAMSKFGRNANGTSYGELFGFVIKSL